VKPSGRATRVSTKPRGPAKRPKPKPARGKGGSKGGRGRR